MSHRNNGLGRLETDELFAIAAGHDERADVDLQGERMQTTSLEHDEISRLRRALEQYREQSRRAAAVDPALADALIQRACDEVPRIPRRPWSVLALVATALLTLLVVGTLQLQPSRETARSTRTSQTVGVRDTRTGEDYPVAERTALETDPRQTLDLRIGASTQVTIRPNSRLRIRHRRRQRKTIAIDRGSAVVAVHGRAPAEQIRVETPRGTVEVTGTVFWVSVAEETTRVAVTEGKTRFVTFDGRVTVVGTRQELVISSRVMELKSLEPAVAAGPTKPPPATPAPGGEAPIALDTAVATEPGPEVLYRRAERAMATGQLRRATRLLGRLVNQQRNTPLAALALFEQATILEHRLRDEAAAARAYCDYLGLGRRARLRHEAREALRRLGWSAGRLQACD
jgi:ferric-dicitrate binding protein FerR (iron transport regulator)